MNVLASIRPDSFDFPLFVHVLGAMVLVGGMVFAITAELVAAGSATPERFRKIAFRTFLLVALPAYIVMRAGAEWIHSKEFPSGVDDPTWVGIGFITADAGAIVLLVTLILSGVASAKGKPGLGRAAAVLAAIALAGWLVAIWAMGAKPS
jgi:hypothetical protein